MNINSFQQCSASCMHAMSMTLKNPGVIPVHAEDFETLATIYNNLQYLIIEDELKNLDQTLLINLTSHNIPKFSALILTFINHDANPIMEYISTKVDILTQTFGKNYTILWGIAADPKLQDNRSRLVVFSGN